MQALLLGSIIGGGYFLSKTGKNSRKSSISNNVFKDPSQNSIYSSTCVIRYPILRKKPQMILYENLKIR